MTIAIYRKINTPNKLMQTYALPFAYLYVYRYISLVYILFLMSELILWHIMYVLLSKNVLQKMCYVNPSICQTLWRSRMFDFNFRFAY